MALWCGSEEDSSEVVRTLIVDETSCIHLRYSSTLHY